MNKSLVPCLVVLLLVSPVLGGVPYSTKKMPIDITDIEQFSGDDGSMDSGWSIPYHDVRHIPNREIKYYYSIILMKILIALIINRILYRITTISMTLDF